MEGLLAAIAGVVFFIAFGKAGAALGAHADKTYHNGREITETTYEDDSEEEY